MKHAKNLPGVGKYDVQKSMDRVRGTYTTKAPISGVMAEAQYKGMTSPSHYNAVNLNLIKQKYRTTRIYKPKTDAPADWKPKRTNAPAVGSYENDKARAMTERSAVKVSINREAKTSFLDANIRKSKNVPGVGKYNVEAAEKRITIGARRGYK